MNCITKQHKVGTLVAQEGRSVSQTAFPEQGLKLSHSGEVFRALPANPSPGSGFLMVHMKTN